MRRNFNRIVRGKTKTPFVTWAHQAGPGAKRALGSFLCCNAQFLPQVSQIERHDEYRSKWNHKLDFYMPIHTQAAYITMNYKYFTYRPKFGILIIRTRPIKESVVRITWAVLEKLLCKSANLYVTAAVKTYTSPVKIGKFTWIGGSVILSGVTIGDNVQET